MRFLLCLFLLSTMAIAAEPKSAQVQEEERLSRAHLTRAKILKWIDYSKSDNSKMRDFTKRILAKVPSELIDEAKNIRGDESPEAEARFQKLLNANPPERVTTQIGQRLLQKLSQTQESKDLCNAAAKFRSYFSGKERDQLTAIEKRLDEISQPLDSELSEEQSTQRSQEVQTLFKKRSALLMKGIDRFQSSPSENDKGAFWISSHSSTSSFSYTGNGASIETIDFTKNKERYRILLQQSNIFGAAYPGPGFLSPRKDASLFSPFMSHVDITHEPSQVMNKIHFVSETSSPVKVSLSDLLNDQEIGPKYQLPDGTLLTDPKEIRTLLNARYGETPETVSAHLGVSFTPNDNRCHLFAAIDDPDGSKGSYYSIPSQLGETWIRHSTKAAQIPRTPGEQTHFSTEMPNVPPVEPVKQSHWQLSGARMLMNPTRPILWVWPAKRESSE